MTPPAPKPSETSEPARDLESGRAVWRRPEIEQLVDAVRPWKLFLVGGAVRDLLLGRAVKDYDFVVDCDAAQLLALQQPLSATTGSTVIVLDERYGILRVCLGEGEELDLAACQGGSLRDDLARRDITFNAMAIDGEGRLIDPFDGCGDLSAGLVRITAPEVLYHDPLRVLRCLRIAATLGFDLEAETREQLQPAVSGLHQVAGERIAAELLSFLAHAEARGLHDAREIGLFTTLFETAGNDRAEQRRREESRLPWQLLEQWWALPENAPPRGWEAVHSVLAALLHRLDPEQQELALDGLRLSKEQRRYLQRWWAAGRTLAEPQEWGGRQVWALRQQAGESLDGLLSFATLPAFTRPLEPSLAERLQKAASGQGELRLEPLPLDGTALCEYHQRRPGPWLGVRLRELQQAWACREVHSQQELLALSERLGEEESLHQRPD